ncbi:FecR domain-containing protein [Planctomicrobium sp. SH661]|uniref:FecR domain-containing protein n=1 Tax=Planctomicrobium sp. SH661 TaxID=3448124 RepID=UPI003F5B5859
MPLNQPQPEFLAIAGSQQATERAAARLTQSANAELVRELLPELGSAFQLDHEYALLKGMIELTFANGATVILNAPAVFHISSSERMELKIGNCSVYAPESARGFEIITPLSRVVDLGTRFSLSVNDSGNSELQVIEGAAELHSQSRPHAVATLLKGEGVRDTLASNAIQTIEFSDHSYQRRLPDRVVSYDARPDARGRGVRDLTSVTVQRGGQTRTYAVEELIGIEVVHMASHSNCNSAASDQPIPENVADLLEADAALNTGLLNFNRDPDLPANVPFRYEDFHARPGLAIRFRTPVRNGPGPDVVLFEVQSVVYPPEGDHFYVSPIQSGDGLHSHYVKSFDVNMSSADAREVAPFQVTVVTPAVKSLGDFARGHSLRGGNVTLSFYALAVGIDLSDLGFEPGAYAEGLFFEDDGMDTSIVDPVFIAGLPETGPLPVNPAPEPIPVVR